MIIEDFLQALGKGREDKVVASAAAAAAADSQESGGGSNKKGPGAGSNGSNSRGSVVTENGDELYADGSLHRIKELCLNCLTELIEKAIKGGEETLTSIRLPGYQASDDDIEIIVGALISSGMKLVELILRNNNISDRGALALCRILHGNDNRHGLPADNCRLTSLDLRGNAIGCKGCQVLATALNENNSLLSLDLGLNPLGRDGGIYLAAMLEGNNTLTRLDLTKADMTDTGVIAIAAALRHGNRSLCELYLSGQLFKSHQEDAARHIGKMLECNHSIQVLDISKCRIRDDGAIYIQKYMMDGKNSSLRKLDLSANEIGITGAEALAFLLLSYGRGGRGGGEADRDDYSSGEGDGITHLNLQNNRIGDGAKAFQAVLTTNRALKSLDFRYNDIQEEGLTALALGMNRNSSLTNLKLWGNHWGQQSCKAFADYIKQRFTLLGVHLDCLPYLVDGVYHVAQSRSSDDGGDEGRGGDSSGGSGGGGGGDGRGGGRGGGGTGKGRADDGNDLVDVLAEGYE